MSRKEMIKDLANLVKAKEVDGIFEMTNKQFETFLDEVEVCSLDNGFEYSVCNNKKDENLKAIYDGAKKNKYLVVRIVKKANVKKSEEKAEEKKTVVRTGATVKVYGEKKSDGRSYKVIEVNNTKVHHYEAWLAENGKRKKVGTSESMEEMIQLVKAA